MVDGEASEYAEVLSGVPQGTVLGPALFLMFINDLPEQVTSQVRLFADDCVLYRTVDSVEDHSLLQQDLDVLKTWELTWQMEFHPKKCCVMNITRKRNPLHLPYSLSCHQLNTVKEAKYTG